ncbi:MAG TPA: 4a-hydroxytetrahydrobiopterin dehydratase [Acidimicrobiales bacterium]|nr:4a-hydroxytetrahydrobiopterin dehydratase [Acidimicrobiales bacterium]
MSGLLAPEDVDDALRSRGLRWRRDGDALVKEVDRADFAGALAYLNRVAALAEAANHHPDVDIRWSKVVLRLSTHSAGGLTARDLELAGQIDALDGESG